VEAGDYRAIDMIEARVGDIAYPKSVAVVTPANGCGIMSRGVAAILSDVRHGGKTLEQQGKALVAKREKPFAAGEMFFTGPGRLRRRGVQRVYHAVLQEFPGGYTSLHWVNQAMRAVMKAAVDEGYDSITLPAIGAGPERLDPVSVAGQMTIVAKAYSHLIGIKFIDANEVFINEIKSLIGMEQESHE